jgi:hypothetical protein
MGNRKPTTLTKITRGSCTRSGTWGYVFLSIADPRCSQNRKGFFRAKSHLTCTLYTVELHCFAKSGTAVLAYLALQFQHTTMLFQAPHYSPEQQRATAEDRLRPSIACRSRPKPATRLNVLAQIAVRAPDLSLAHHWPAPRVLASYPPSVKRT